MYVYFFRSQKINTELLFRFILNARYLYSDILVTYYTNLPEIVQKELNSIDPLKEAMKEVEDIESSVSEINAAAEDVLGGFFKALLASKQEWNLKFGKHF